MGYWAAEPQHRVLARRHHHAGIGTMHNCVVQIGIGEATYLHAARVGRQRMRL